MAFPLIPLIQAVVQAGSDSTNKRNQIENAARDNAFSVFTGQARQSISPFLNNTSAATLGAGLQGSLLQKENDEILGALKKLNKNRNDGILKATFTNQDAGSQSNFGPVTSGINVSELPGASLNFNSLPGETLSPNQQAAQAFASLGLS